MKIKNLLIVILSVVFLQQVGCSGFVTSVSKKVIEGISNPERVYGYTISPNGRWLVCFISDYFGGKDKNEIELIDLSECRKRDIVYLDTLIAEKDFPDLDFWENNDKLILFNRASWNYDRWHRVLENYYSLEIEKSSFLKRHNNSYTEPESYKKIQKACDGRIISAGIISPRTYQVNYIEKGSCARKNIILGGFDAGGMSFKRGETANQLFWGNKKVATYKNIKTRWGVRKPYISSNAKMSHDKQYICFVIDWSPESSWGEGGPRVLYLYNTKTGKVIKLDELDYGDSCYTVPMPSIMIWLFNNKDFIYTRCANGKVEMVKLSLQN